MTKSSPKWINFAPITVDTDKFVTSNFQSVQLPSFIRDVCGQFAIEARNKKIDLIFEFDSAAEHQIKAESLYSMMANPCDLHVMISQMLKNSLAQTLEGYIKIRLSKFDQMFAIEVEDSGMGVHPDEKIAFVESVYRGNVCRITYVQDPKIDMTKMAPYLEGYGASMQLRIDPGNGMTRRLLLPAKVGTEQGNPAVEELIVAY